MKDFVFSVFTNKHKSCLIHTSKRDTQSQRSLKIVMKKALINRARLLRFINWCIAISVHNKTNAM